jgi:hypothetical protein
MTVHLPQLLAKHLRDVHYGGNWTFSNLKDQLNNITWQQATTRIDSLNTIAALTYHIHYYVAAILKVIEGGPLDAHDKFSFDHPPVTGNEDWETLKTKIFREADRLVGLIDTFPKEKLGDLFADEKYGTFYRNFQGLIEHTHYHLGQIAVIKKLVSST